MPVPPSTPAERFAALLLWLGRAVAARSGGDRLSLPLIALIIGRIREIGQRVAKLAARIRDGKYAPRRSALPRRRAVCRMRRPSKLPQTFGWLLQLVPEAVGYRSQLEHLFRDAEMAALLAAAPAALRRPLRSLCWMLRVSPPPILAQPRPAARQAAPAAAQAPPPPSPAPCRAASAPTEPPPARACGPPLPA